MACLQQFDPVQVSQALADAMPDLTVGEIAWQSREAVNIASPADPVDCRHVIGRTVTRGTLIEMFACNCDRTIKKCRPTLSRERRLIPDPDGTGEIEEIVLTKNVVMKEVLPTVTCGVLTVPRFLEVTMPCTINVPDVTRVLVRRFTASGQPTTFPRTVTFEFLECHPPGVIPQFGTLFTVAYAVSQGGDKLSETILGIGIFHDVNDDWWVHNIGSANIPGAGLRFWLTCIPSLLFDASWSMGFPFPTPPHLMPAAPDLTDFFSNVDIPNANDSMSVHFDVGTDATIIDMSIEGATTQWAYERASAVGPPGRCVLQC